MPGILHHATGLTRAIGPYRAANVMLRRAMRRSAPVSLTIPANHRRGAYTILLRPTDSDLFVASQVFGWREYELTSTIERKLTALEHEWRAEGTVPVIVDGGANIGYSSVYYATRFPDAIVIAAEPNPASYELLLKNTSEFWNIIPAQAALWQDEDGVELEFPDCGSWAVRTVAPHDDRDRTKSIRVESLVETIANGRLLICKLDIEGAEKEVCSASAGILRSAACVIVETHDFLFDDDRCQTAVNDALAPTMSEPLAVGENLVFLNESLLSG